MNQTNKQKKKEEEEIDFNSRSSSDKEEVKEEKNKTGRTIGDNAAKNNTSMQQYMTTNSNPLGNTNTINENIMMIEKLVNQHGSGVV